MKDTQDMMWKGLLLQGASRQTRRFLKKYYMSKQSMIVKPPQKLPRLKSIIWPNMSSRCNGENYVKNSRIYETRMHANFESINEHK